MLIEPQDQILNATAARHCYYEDLLAMPIKDMIIHPAKGASRNDITNSEVRHEGYELVDQRGYRTYREHRADQWLLRTTEELVEMC